MENHAPWPVGLQPATREEAEQAFSAGGLRDPQQLAASGTCFKFDTLRGRALLSVGPKGETLWVYAAAGQGDGLSKAMTAMLELIARRSGFKAIGYQTRRRGGVEIGARLGFQICARNDEYTELKKVIA